MFVKLKRIKLFIRLKSRQKARKFNFLKICYMTNLMCDTMQCTTPQVKGLLMVKVRMTLTFGLLSQLFVTYLGVALLF